MSVIAFFNNKVGVGKTSLVYHLAWMYAEVGLKTLAIDLDPQANLSAMFLDEDRLEALWPDGEHPLTVAGAIRPIQRGLGDIADPHIETIEDNILLVVGDLALSRFEDRLSETWPKCLDGDEASFRAMSAFHRIISLALKKTSANVVLIDVGPNLGAINRAAMLAAEYVAIPVAPDLFSAQGLKNLGPALRDWRRAWRERLTKNPDPELDLPAGNMTPAGYVALQHAVRLDRPVKAYDRWMQRIPADYQSNVLGQTATPALTVKDDPHCLALLKHYRSLMPLAMEANKPMFLLRSADGAIGAHQKAVLDCYRDFRQLAANLAAQTGLTMPAI